MSTKHQRKHQRKHDPPLLPVSACPTCKYQMDAAMCVGNRKHRPRPDDFSLCSKCGEVLVFTADLTLRPADLKDLLKLGPVESRKMTLAQLFIRQHRPIP